MATTQAFFFGPSRRLSGIYHAGTAGPGMGAVLLCPPLLQEGIRAQWALRQTALKLAATGYDVLRFDFTGMGNSAGEVASASLSIWRDDLFSAIGQLEEMTGSTTPISVVAARYTCSLLSGMDRAFTGCCVWDPVLSGQDWLNDLGVVRDSMAKEMPFAVFGEFEFAGFNLSKHLYGELAAHERVPFVANARDTWAVIGVNVPPDPALGPGVIQTQVAVPYSWTQIYSPVLFVHPVVQAITGLFTASRDTRATA